MAVFICRNHGLILDIKPIEVRDHLCGRFIRFKVSLKFNNGTTLLLPEMFDDGRLLPFFSNSLTENSEKDEERVFDYNNNIFSYLNEPLYNINIGCSFNEKSISQGTLFEENNNSFFSQPTLFGQLKEKEKNNVNISFSLIKSFKSNCCWEDFIDYVMSQQSVSKIVRNRTNAKVKISIKNGCLDDLLLGEENLGKEMEINTSIFISQNLEDFRTSIFQLKSELESIKPNISTIIDSNIMGQKRFDLGPEAKPFVDIRRLKRLDDLKKQLEIIFAKDKSQRKTALYEISAYIEYFLFEEIRKSLSKIIRKFEDKNTLIKAIQSVSFDLGNILSESDDEETIIGKILNSEFVTSFSAKMILQARSEKDIVSVFDKIYEGNSLKKLFKIMS